ncbi:hypothetical protein QE152_g17122 [Popillia japonica]|uniref:Uncharacterized protein n=1 Tax=Popillia japonica TaxID=7064 RepID=A0AAW1L6I2_POPJA
MENSFTASVINNYSFIQFISAVHVPAIRDTSVLISRSSYYRTLHYKMWLKNLFVFLTYFDVEAVTLKLKECAGHCINLNVNGNKQDIIWTTSM